MEVRTSIATNPDHNERAVIANIANRIRIGVMILALAAGLWPAPRAVAGPLSGLELEGYTEPYRTIKVASDETGTISEMLVREGDRVEAGQPLVRLNSEVFLAALAVAEQNMNSRGRLDAARAELHLRRERFEKLKLLRAEGHANPEEVDRAAADVEVAEANLLGAQEELVTRKLEYERVKIQIDRRTIRAPITGTVTQLLRQKGEFVAPNAPDVVTLVQLDPLLAIVTVTSPEAVKYHQGAPVKVYFLAGGLEADGTVEFVAPVTDAESGMVRIKVRISNAESRYRSGERCKVRLVPSVAKN